jgi:hypothetical protein
MSTPDPRYDADAGEHLNIETFPLIMRVFLTGTIDFKCEQSLQSSLCPNAWSDLALLGNIISNSRTSLSRDSIMHTT